MCMGLDCYKVLGLSRGAAEEDIKREYRKIAKKYHPDANPGNDSAARKFREAAEAYAVLGDAQKREAYDRELDSQKTGGFYGAGKRAGKNASEMPWESGKNASGMPWESGKNASGATGTAGKNASGASGTGGRPPAADFDFGRMSGSFEQFFGFNPESGKVNAEKLNPDKNKKKSANPIDMTEMFERYMGVKK